MSISFLISYLLTNAHVGMFVIDILMIVNYDRLIFIICEWYFVIEQKYRARILCQW